MNDTRPMPERLTSRVAVPLMTALAASAKLLGDGHRLTKALESVRSELQKEIDERKTPLKAAARKTRQQ